MLSEVSALAKDLAAVATFLLPGFLCLALFDLANRRIARQRPDLTWILWSLTISLLIVPLTANVFARLGRSHDTLDPTFYLATIVFAAVTGYLGGRLAGAGFGRGFAHWLGLVLPVWVWIEVFAEARWVIVHMTDGTQLYGFPRRFTDDPREATKELYLTFPSVLTNTDCGEEFVALDRTEGVLVDSTRIAYIQVISPAEPSTGGDEGRRIHPLVVAVMLIVIVGLSLAVLGVPAGERSFPGGSAR
ncbi:MAG: DUF6338 family protein [Dehalococcoidia bacterium]